MVRTSLFVMLVVALPGMVAAQSPPRVATSTPRLDWVAASLSLKAPAWLKDYQFQRPKFTFVRIQYDSAGRGGARFWATDYPDAELNLMATLGRLTKLDVSEPSRVMRLTDAAIAEHPILYISEPGNMSLSDAEITALRKYLDAGGFLLMDDFWGEAETQNVLAVLKRVFPDREPVDLPLSHPLFHCAFDLKEKPQVLSIHAFFAGQASERRDAPEAHYRAIQDDRGKIMVLLCQNTDLADGWERANEDVTYTREMSIAKAYPMGLNILFFALTQPKR